ncbi:transposase [Alienimonas californiensis]|uniref:Transposase DDE domain protein n=1 Tax=Alienimonas californiensis TaxID=2527989 RepID=A0A517P9D9_9PLAN|nr:transposase [Alienimonas californiensis]QDT15982.1 Transposase DDE domain protein [Alienimonas californiensis]QDT16128.1 Transposase DDE domain protein [Alienimonas californiensis]QDT16519.1 Transposase DDE domain protein [Alienimonas californiensis]
MRHQLWTAIVAELARLHNGRPGRGQRFSDRRILEVYFFAVVRKLPVRHACDARNWPVWLRGRPLPSPAAMSRRMRSRSVRELLAALDQAVVRPPAGRGDGGLAHWIDSTPLPIGPTSTDRHAAFGHAGGTKANGYRLHLFLRGDGSVADWRLTPMNRDERVMARRMIRSAKATGYLVGDGNFDVNALHGECEVRGDLRLIAPKRKGGFGRRKHRRGRYESAALLAEPRGPFAAALMTGRIAVERFFGTLKSAGTGLIGLPPWVRTMPRVRPFVITHLILDALRRRGAVAA